METLASLLHETTQYVEKALEAAIDGFLTEDVRAVSKVYEFERLINAAHMAIDEHCVRILGSASTLPEGDLRFVVAAIKINTDLERMGDQSVNIADNATRYFGGRSVQRYPLIKDMCREVTNMAQSAMKSFVERDAELARTVLKMDDTIDRMKDESFRTLTKLMQGVPGLVEPGMALVLIARNLERIGDHASNIAEDVIYLVSGEDVRHPGERPKDGAGPG